MKRNIIMVSKNIANFFQKIINASFFQKNKIGIILINIYKFILIKIQLLIGYVKKIKWNKIIKKPKSRLAKIIFCIILIYIIFWIITLILFYKYHKEDTNFCKISSKFVFIPVGWVNWQPLSISNFYLHLNYSKKYYQTTDQELGQEEIGGLKKEIINQMIDSKLFEQQIKKQKTKIAQKEIDDLFNKIASENEGIEKFTENLSNRYDLSANQFKFLIKNNLYIEKLFMQVYTKNIIISDEKLAKEVLEKVKKGDKSFEDLAKEYSEDTKTKDNGGDFGWLYKDQTVKEYEDVVFKMKKGDISDLIKTEIEPGKTVYFIVKLEDKKGLIEQSPETWLNDAKSKAKIKHWLY